ncbi:IS66 family insertion sequence element accessory protein TnpB [Bradyrhizobium sp. LB5.2]|uniref:IS66 family insertion sequence element accessory protein TnpB n=1 Tax=unclassified Bradyrhizobium TaxID=2631580 RepID=UPI00339727C0
MVATKPVDFRKRMERLAILVREHMRADPFSTAVYMSVPSAQTGSSDRLRWYGFVAVRQAARGRRLLFSHLADFRASCIDDGRIELRNNTVQRSIQGIKVCRKNVRIRRRHPAGRFREG